MAALNVRPSVNSLGLVWLGVEGFRQVRNMSEHPSKHKHTHTHTHTHTRRDRHTEKHREIQRPKGTHLHLAIGRPGGYMGELC